LIKVIKDLYCPQHCLKLGSVRGCDVQALKLIARAVDWIRQHWIQKIGRIRVVSHCHVSEGIGDPILEVLNSSAVGDVGTQLEVNIEKIEPLLNLWLLVYEENVKDFRYSGLAHSILGCLAKISCDNFHEFLVVEIFSICEVGNRC